MRSPEPPTLTTTSRQPRLPLSDAPTAVGDLVSPSVTRTHVRFVTPGGKNPSRGSGDRGSKVVATSLTSSGGGASACTLRSSVSEKTSVSRVGKRNGRRRSGSPETPDGTSGGG